MIAPPGLTPTEETELRKAVSGGWAAAAIGCPLAALLLVLSGLHFHPLPLSCGLCLCCASCAGMQLGHLVLEPKDVEILSKEGLKAYWIHRDICLNEVLLMRLAPGAPLTLFYSDGALHDAQKNVIRSMPHALKSDFTEIWALDGAQPILSTKHVARTIVR